MTTDPHRYELPEPGGWRWLAASVHLFTALGIVCALLAAHALLDRAYETAFAWLGIALIIDGIDGAFARALDVKRRLPRFSGEKLDQVVDYVTYVFVPALALQLGGHLDGLWGGILASLILLSSLYHFCDNGNKADDHCFVGFPAIWNIVAFYIFAFALPGWAVSILVLVCVALTFVPMRWLHPMRVKALRPLNLAMSGVWAFAAVWTVATGFPAGPGAMAALGLVAVYGVGLSVLWPLLGGDEAP
ncbi:CDP-alcohol phosphatidyltransferase family protein [Hyphomicrobium sp. CS1BSMeth3]|uniref:CDP-alcohol phosphatidyltransferase family protein n=1 Tax=Hyphomicrobium sp. CS1BSMeth3 TaxID=1892844 RepID=UPI000931DE6F|nr:CDP-alcohol phosphatidyltransferase family protein [Hyphomicrobium sp. CS1BSMeth3]